MLCIKGALLIQDGEGDKKKKKIIKYNESNATKNWGKAGAACVWVHKKGKQTETEQKGQAQ